LITKNDKRIFSIYQRDEKIFNLYTGIKDSLKKAAHYPKRVMIRIWPEKGHYDFSLAPHKKRRIVYFELPCFDNLGDHAIAFVTEYIINDFCKNNKEYQLFVVDGWDIDNAIAALRGNLGAEDVIICQGGGNFGNLYDFAEALRRKTLNTYRNNRIIIMPQTFFYTKDAEGIGELKKDQKAINSCRNLTLFARDEKSYRLMKKYFNCEVLQLHDVVSMYDPSYVCSSERNGTLVCLRSDKEGRLSVHDKLTILKICEDSSENVFVTDTCLHYDIDPKDRIEIIEKKWSLFGKAKFVITDRLHGMIFSLITKTPCIVIGNNHHKVYETYKTFRDCSYITYVNSVDEIEKAMSYISTIDETKKMDLSKDINVLADAIVRGIKNE
jgi:exopolysaccharide biosynthesis predicted pyruvyltransferase EpsI